MSAYHNNDVGGDDSKMRRRSKLSLAAASFDAASPLTSARARWVFAAVLVVSCLGLANEMMNTGGKADLYGTRAGRAAAAIVKEGGGDGADADSLLFSSADDSKDVDGADDAKPPARLPSRKRLVDNFHLATTSQKLFAPAITFLDEPELPDCTPQAPLRWSWRKHADEYNETSSLTPDYEQFDIVWDREIYVRQNRPDDLALMTDSLSLPVPEMIIGISNATQAVYGRRRHRKLKDDGDKGGSDGDDEKDTHDYTHLHPKKRLLLVTYQQNETSSDNDDNPTLLAYAKLWGHDMLTVQGPALPKYITVKGERRVCLPNVTSLHMPLQIIPLLRVALLHRNEYDTVLVVPPQTVIRDLGRDVTKLLPSKHVVGMRSNGSDKPVIDTSVSLWNLHHPLLHAMVVDWMAAIQRAIRKEWWDEYALNKWFGKLVQAGELMDDHVTMSVPLNTVVRTDGTAEDIRDICQRFAPACN